MSESPARASDRGALLAGAIIVLAALAAYSDSFRGALVMDDLTSIVANPSIRHLWPLSVPLHPPQGEGLTVEGRPVLNLSLAVNYAISGTRVWSYHAANLLIHVLAGLTLFGVVRRTLLGRSSAGAPATALAFATALLWTLHPLQTESVTYVVQRAESLMGLFYLLTLYCFIRHASGDPASAGRPAADGNGQVAWARLSVAFCVLGMATKEVMVSAPVVVLLYDRTFVVGDFRSALRRRRWLYVGLLATWIPLALLVARTGSRGGTSGFGSGVKAAAYWMSQFPAVFRYVRLAFWPHPLVFDYGTTLVSSVRSVWPEAIVVVALAAGSIVALWRRPAVGFLGCWFFALLAPTSLVPGNRQTMAEHRMYLALAPVAFTAVYVLFRVFGRWGLAVIMAIAAVFGTMTYLRNLDYRSLLALYADTAAKAPDNPYAQSNLGLALFASEQVEAAIGRYREAVRLRPNYETAHDNLGNALLHEGRGPEAIEEFEIALRLNPDDPDAHGNLGTALFLQGSTGAAADQFRAALRLDPKSAEANNNLGNALAQLGRLSEAVSQYQEALRLDPDYVQARYNLGRAYLRLGRTDDGTAELRAALRIQPDFRPARELLERMRER